MGSLETGDLIVQVPHWLVQINIYDNAYRLVNSISEFDQINQNTGLYEKKISLTPGIYEIEAAFANKASRKLVRIIPGKETVYHPDDDIRSIISSDDSGLTKPNTGQLAGPSIAWDNFKENSQGDANLCLRIRLPDKVKADAANFQSLFSVQSVQDVHTPCDGLTSNDVISSFNELRIFEENGEIYLNKDLPSGYYIVKWQIDEQKSCRQPLYLHSGYSTRVYVTIRVPVAKAFHMSMVEKGTESSRYHDEELALQSILATINRDTNESIVSKREMKMLLAGESNNPWLAVVAAYAITKNMSILSRTSLEEKQDLLDEILSFLQQRIPAHPDVHALLLRNDIPANNPFYFPPLLFKGLQRVSDHHGIFKTTIPENSLTSFLVQTTLMDTPWVNWNPLSEKPEPDEVKNELVTSIPGNDESMITPVIDITKPFFKGNLYGYDKIQRSMTSALMEGSSGISEYITSFATLQEASLVNAMQTIPKNVYYNDLPQTYVSDSFNSLFSDIIPANAIKIGFSTKLPVSTVHAGIESIMKKRDLMTIPANEMDQLQLTKDEQSILKYAMFTSEPSIGFEMPVHTDSSIVVKVENEESCIEDCVARIAAEARRMLTDSTTGSPLYAQNSLKISTDLNNICHRMLKRADFLVTTTAAGSIVYCNGAFMYLISPDMVQHGQLDLNDPGFSRNRELSRLNTRRNWESAIKLLPLGKSVIDTPVTNSFFDSWEVRRTELKEANHESINGFINVLRGENAHGMLQEELEKILAIVSNLEVYTPMYVLDANKEDNEYWTKIDDMVKQLEQILLSPSE